MGEFRSDYQRLAGYAAVIVFLLPAALFGLHVYMANTIEPASAARDAFLAQLPSFMRSMYRVSVTGVTASGLALLLCVAAMSSFGRFMRFILTLILLLCIALGIVYLFWLM